MASLQEKALNLVNETSEKYVADPSRDAILSDILIGIRRFSNSVRWKECWMLEKQKRMRESGSTISSITNNTKNSEDFEESTTGSNTSSSMSSFTPNDDSDDDNYMNRDDGGLQTNLKPVHRIKRAPTGTYKLEAFLKVQRPTQFQC